MDVIYIAGSGRSGSTLLTRILGQLDGFASPGELRHLWKTGAPLKAPDELCGCGETYEACALWSRVADEVFPGLDQSGFEAYREQARSVDRTRYVPWMLGLVPAPKRFNERLSRYRKLTDKLFRSILDNSGARVLVDASKDPSTLYLLATQPGVRLTVVHLVRDVRGVTFSWRKKKRRPEFVDRDVFMRQHSVWKVVRFWTYCNQLTELSKRLAPSYCFIRYEDFVRQPVESVRRICAATGISDPDLSFLTDDSCRLERPCHIISGNPNRFSGSEIRFRVDEEWRTQMRPGERRLATALGAPMLARYGYPLG